MKIDLNFQFKGIDDKELPKVNEKGDVIESNNAGKVTGLALWYYSSGRSMKFEEWGKKLYAGKPVEIDTTDYEILLAWLETYGQVADYKGSIVPILQTDGIRSQVQRSIKAQKEKQEAK